jgi:uracil-DNA glycosylase family 4
MTYPREPSAADWCGVSSIAGYSAAMAPEAAALLRSGVQADHVERPFRILSSTSSSVTTAFDALRDTMLACRRCPNLVKSRSRVVPGNGAVPAAVAFVGLAPGRFGGDRTGIPFDGDRSGQLLRRMIKHARLRGVFITNVVRCNPRDLRGRNRDPDAAEIANCNNHLMAELSLVNPWIVVCLGRIAWNTLAGREFPFEPREPVLIKAQGIRLLPMYHPAYVIRGAYAERYYRRDFIRLAKLLRAGLDELPSAGAWSGD